ncbi:hypothetical protein L596_019013 [Steinernema carpocapsae]|uniref:Uncharacterized protein n=1 Tax=Steinernema carpocapsae TaxID=34508 RepID=A0A4U5N6E7_STECR|nr:hypothetical protein L596_019013 [Steinernema carpocapsae]
MFLGDCGAFATEQEGFGPLLPSPRSEPVNSENAPILVNLGLKHAAESPLQFVGSPNIYLFRKQVEIRVKSATVA